MNRILSCLLLLTGILCQNAWPSADTAAGPATVTSSVRTVAVFKNGLGFFMRDGEALLTDGWASSDVVPNAALGTFWVGSACAGMTIDRLTAGYEEVPRTVPAVTIPELLTANVGRRVRFAYADKVAEGKLLALPEDPGATAYRPTYPVLAAIPPVTAADLVLVETAGGTLAIPKHSVTWVEFAEPPATVLTRMEKVKRLHFKVNGATGRAPVSIGYLQKGITWSPAYLVELQDEKTVRLTMQGLLVNDAEDIVDAGVFFAVGYPNFVHADRLSPLALTQTVGNFIDSLSQPGRRYSGIAAQMVGNQAAGYDFERDSTGGIAGAGGGEFGYSSRLETPGTAEEDLFLYRMTGVSLRKDERAYYTIFSATIPFEHIYAVDIPNTTAVQPSGYVSDSRGGDAAAPEDQVWHSLRLTNDTKFPWTTAPALAMANGQPLAQDTILYTARGARSELKLTIATDVRVKKSEVEKSRQEDALRLQGNTFAKVTAAGTVTLKNFKAVPIKVAVTKILTGDVEDTSAEGKVVKVAEGMKAVNPASRIAWEVPLQPGEERTLTYTYFVYVRY